MIIEYLYDLGKIGIAKVRVIIHGLTPGNFLHRELSFSCASYELRIWNFTIPLERTEVIVCECGKVFYERYPGMAKEWEEVYDALKRRFEKVKQP